MAFMRGRSLASSALTFGMRSCTSSKQGSMKYILKKAEENCRRTEQQMSRKVIRWRQLRLRAKSRMSIPYISTFCAARLPIPCGMGKGANVRADS